MREGDQAGQAGAAEERVVAALGVEDELLAAADVDGERRGSMRWKRTRPPTPWAEKASATSPPFTSTVSVPSPPSLRSEPSPGFQIMRSLPDSPEGLVGAGAAGEGVVAAAAEELVVAALAEQHVVPLVAVEGVGAGAAGQGVVAAAAGQAGLGQYAVGLVEQQVSLPPSPETRMVWMFATVAGDRRWGPRRCSPAGCRRRCARR